MGWARRRVSWTTWSFWAAAVFCCASLARLSFWVLTLSVDENLQVVLIVSSVALGVGLLAYVVRSETIRRYGVLGALRRRFSGGRIHSQGSSSRGNVI